MDFGDIFGLVGQFFIDYCGIRVAFFDTSFSIGALFVWSALACLIITWVKEIFR